MDYKLHHECTLEKLPVLSFVLQPLNMNLTLRLHKTYRKIQISGIIRVHIENFNVCSVFGLSGNASQFSIQI